VTDPRVRRALGYVAASAALLVGWELLALALGSPAFPGPSAALPAFVELVPVLWPNALVSAARILVAMAAGTLLAVPIGLWAGRSPKIDAVFAPLLYLTYPVPKVVFLPVFMILLGIGNVSKVVLLGIIVFFQILVTARDAARAVPPTLVLSVRSLGAKRLDIARHVVLPAALPEIFTALRIALGTAVAVLFFAESTAGSDGLGWFIMDAMGRIDYPRMFAGILAMALLGVVLYEVLDWVDAWANRWMRAGAPRA
jgi:ABC-type nitrate/sulfonate/bicarbonate transport system permease component